MCAMKGHIFALGLIPDIEGVIHKYTYGGELVASFGTLYRSHHVVARESLSVRGFLACNEQNGVVAWIRQYFPVVTGFSSDGKALWKIKLTDFQPALVREITGRSGEPGMSHYPMTEGQSQFMDMFSDDNDHIYVTFAVQGSGKKLARTKSELMYKPARVNIGLMRVWYRSLLMRTFLPIR